MLRPRGVAPWTRFRCAFGFLHPDTRALGRLLGPCFKTGRWKPLRQGLPRDPQAGLRLARAVHCCSRASSSAAWPRPALRARQGGGVAWGLQGALAERVSKPTLVRPPAPRANDCSSTASFSAISSLLTLFPKFFSSFLRSTCSLSVSHRYLALEEVYLPLRAAIPNNPTRRVLSYGRVLARHGVVTLSGVPFQGTCARTVPSDRRSRLQFRGCAPGILSMS